jgi:excinuclease UvrABC nuclease subunit
MDKMLLLETNLSPTHKPAYNCQQKKVKETRKKNA